MKLVETKECTCDFCGRKYQGRVGGRGRQSYYCPDTNCGRAKRFWDAFVRDLNGIELTDEARKLLRTEVMRLVNQKLHNNKRKEA